jgi:hypothetical protein
MKIITNLALGLAVAAGLATAGAAHELVDWADVKAAIEDHHCEADQARSDLLKGVQERRGADQAARDDLQAQIASRRAERAMERLQEENAKMRDLLTALGVDVDKALAAR